MHDLCAEPCTACSTAKNLILLWYKKRFHIIIIVVITEGSQATRENVVAAQMEKWRELKSVEYSQQETRMFS